MDKVPKVVVFCLFEVVVKTGAQGERGVPEFLPVLAMTF
jgi:hypothetical protein